MEESQDHDEAKWQDENGEWQFGSFADIALDRDSLSLKAKGDTGTLTASVTPDHAPIGEVTWTSSDESAATVDENGKVTAVGKGTALITATTVSPYHETASCNVTVGKFRLMTRAEYGEIQYTSEAVTALWAGRERNWKEQKLS